MGVDYSENCLVWKGEALNAAGRSFSKNMFGPGPVDERSYSAADTFPPVIRRKRPQVLADMCSRVEAFVLRQNQEPIQGKLGPRARL